MRVFKHVLWLLLACFFCSSAFAADTATIKWNDWSDTLFDQAAKEHRLIILDLEAVWCHWCHVMDQQTYHNADVVKMINAHYIPVRVDQDARPDLSIHYQDYGWPATIIFNEKGEELAKLAGYIEPDKMLKILKALDADKNNRTLLSADGAAETYSTQAILAPALKTQLQQRQDELYDSVKKSWGGKDGGQKYMDIDSTEYAMIKAENGDKAEAQKAHDTLHAQLSLMDRVWGGVYQYSTDGDWLHPHFEKIMSIQTGDMRDYAQAYSIWQDPLYLITAKKIDSFLTKFLMSPDGAFYTSQDADVNKGEHSAEYFKMDDKQRRALGIPHVDTHIYACENGWVITALAQLYMASSDNKFLTQALKAEQWVVNNRSLSGGGFRHDEKDVAGPYLDDTLAMGRAFLALYQATGDRKFLTRAEQAANFIDKHFQAVEGKPGFMSAALTGNKITNEMQEDRDENVALTRFTNLLYYYTGNQNFKKMAQSGMKFLVTPMIAQYYYPAPVLIADLEMSQEPLHITIIGNKDDAETKKLYTVAMSYPSSYKRIEWWDTREGALPNSDVEYPPLNKPAAFVCENHRCSVPNFTAEDLEATLKKLSAAH